MKKASPKKLCKRGYCSAKAKYAVYPSAYANSYAVKVCKGEADDYRGKRRVDSAYLKRASGKKSSLRRWHREAWVNVCEKGEGPGGYKICGSGKGLDKPKKYPYCRPYYKQPGTTVVTARELSPKKRKEMCRRKRSLTPGVGGKPTRVYVTRSRSPRGTRSRSPRGLRSRGSPKTPIIPIPRNVAKAAREGLELMKLGYKGGTETGWKRGRQLANNAKIDPYSLSVMRAWFARHGPDAASGGTSYPGYYKWKKAGKPKDVPKNSLRGAVAWLIWGGDPAYKWLKTTKIRRVLEEYYPNKKTSSIKIKLKN